jgi:hyaluronoglucosaminidase
VGYDPWSPPRRSWLSRCSWRGWLSLAVVGLVGGCGGTSAGLARVQAGAIAYVWTGAFNADPGTSVAVVDLAGDHALSPVALGAGSLPSALAATADGRRLLVTAQGVNELVVLDSGTGSVVRTVTTGLEPDAVAVGGPGGTTALVANLGDGTVTPVDLTTLRAGRPIPVGPGPTGIAWARRAQSAWVSVGSSLIPIDVAPGTAGTAIAVGHVAQAVALGPRGTTAWVAGIDGTVTPVDLRTGRAQRAMHVGGRPSAILVPSAQS